MVGEEGAFYQNKVRPNLFGIFVLILVIIWASVRLNDILAAHYPTSATLGKAIGFCTSMIGLALFFIALFLKEAYYDAPTKVAIRDEGVDFLFRFKPPEKLKWSEIDSISAIVKERTIVPANPKLSGLIMIKGSKSKRHVRTSYDVANLLISHFKGNPASMAGTEGKVAQDICMEGEKRPSDNVVYAALAGIGSSMTFVGFLLISLVGDLQLETIFGGTSIILAIVAISRYRIGFHALKPADLKVDCIEVPISVFERVVGKSPRVETRAIAELKVLRSAKLMLDTRQLEDPRYYALFIRDDGSEYSVGPRNQATISMIASFIYLLGKPISYSGLSKSRSQP